MSKMNAQTAINHIQEIKTSAELNQVIKAIKIQQSIIQQQMAISFAVGDKVTFAGRGDSTVRALITKINRKTILVKDLKTKTLWKVSPSLLTAAA